MTRPANGGRVATGLRIALAVCVAAAAGQLVAFKMGWAAPRPPVIASFVVAAICLATVEALARVVRAARGRSSRVREAGVAMLLLGLVLAGAGGLANWLQGLQGVVLLTEGETVALSRVEQLQVFEPGPLSDIDELRMSLTLVDMAFLPAGPGHFSPVSTLLVARQGEQPVQVVVRPGAVGESGSIRFFQGAFGFAPRIVVLKDEQAFFDQVVPFTTDRHGGQRVSFEGSFSIEREGLAVSGGVTLDSLDEQMKGHPTLDLTVRRGGGVLGQGKLLPGHFADLEEGYRIGFAGLKKWSEIDLSRRNYPLPVFLGIGLVLAGSLLWSIATVKRW